MNADGEVNNPTNPKLFAKLARVMAGIERIPKSGRNEHFSYDFATDSDVSDVIRTRLAQEGVCFLVSQVGEPKRSAKSVEVNFAFTFACGETGATWTSYWTGEAQDGQDKGISKAATSALKYFLMKTFMISTGDPTDDPDGDKDATKKAPEKTRKSDDGAKARQQQPTPDTDWAQDDARWNALVKRAMTDLWPGVTLPHARNRVMAALRLAGGWDARHTFTGTPREAWALVAAYVPAGEDAAPPATSQDPLFDAADYRSESD